ncbi:hypothetical protein GS501_01050 [Saccharibacter sp. 17.LH.SD]|uniref:fasciclin domain-containing protein n=1 Tax=Saccharibacter sp. 17.LH.SD TaxID=2689393 RepID=UPI001371061D|nr:fasciclin domain-containing protein [Saccharibacter sp. 17.LH.SD]MXV43662.1 hypothetical protein [Saccharibacter sp. 17.LH.SD]
MGIVLLLGGGGCSHQSPDRQDMYFTRPSGYSEVMPRAKSIEREFVPSKDGESPNSPVAYHVTPSVSYEDRTLDENLASSLENADYYRAVKRAGWQRWLQAEGPYTVLAISDDALEAHVKEWPGRWDAPENHARLVRLIGQTILVGKWDLPTLIKQARRHNGVVTVTTFNGTHLALQLLSSSGDIALQDEGHEFHVMGKGFPQSNGMLYMIDTVLPY